ncbi:cyclic-di-AMP-binding protein CbpB [Streptococcus oricebi]|uniref:CBS domain-containing protein n=1 Tax=Streptococcus oricebi TaxID=1547447 RepID=A0ABS5B3J0_9STRE|nr:cyclic-di-AMP-binding protein CbpB [Streptococcus oricebi]MBP2623408.1 CBS domain-containing protein [Streptococcus oricebi]
MIAKEFEDYLLEQEETFLTPAADLAVLIDSHNVDHAILLLSQMTYSRVPVVTADKKFVGTISLTDILSYQMQHDLPDQEFMSMDIVYMTKKDVPKLEVNYSLTKVLHQLVDTSFLPVVDEGNTFMGIITRKSILKVINSLLHDFTNQYEMKAK